MRTPYATPAAMPCVLWLPERRAYVRSAEVLQGQVSTTDRPTEARRYRPDAAAVASLYLRHQTGLRVELRPCHHDGRRTSA